MAKPKTPSQKKTYDKLSKQIGTTVDGHLGKIEKKMAVKSALIASRAGAEEGAMFRFKDHADKTDEVNKMFEDFEVEFEGFVKEQAARLYKQSNAQQDKIETAAAKHYAKGAAEEETADKVQKVSKEDILSHYNPRSPYKVPTYYSTKDDALKAFLQRKDPNGMNLSKRVWNLTPEYRVAIEDAISVALKKGQGPVALSHKVVRYLRDYDKLNADYKRQFGTARKAKDCHYAAYRLAYTEINMAYRTAEQERWRAIDDIVGYEVKTRESSHKDADVCDMLQGKYPKTFKWVGWHPLCHCYAVPIFRSDDETAQGSKAAVRDVPSNYREWVKRNAEGIERAQGRGTLPYFLKDNAGTWSGAVQEARYDREVELIRRVLRGANASLPVGKKGVGALTGSSELDSTQAKKEAASALLDNEYKRKYELAKLSDVQKENLDKLAKAIGARSGKPMRFADADSGSVNPTKGKDNCVNCVYTFEARRRGLDVVASKKFDASLSEHPYNGWVRESGKIPQYEKVKVRIDGSHDDIKRQLQDALDRQTAPVGSRYFIAFDKPAETGKKAVGHIFYAERTAEKSLIFYDPQKNSYPSLGQILEVMDKNHGLELLRIDKLLFADEAKAILGV